MARGKFRILSPLSILRGRSHLYGGTTRAANLSYKLTLIYAILGTLWILLSDLGLTALLAQIEHSGWTVARAQTLKGWGYVLITAVSLYLILNHFSGRVAARNAALGAMEEAFRDFAESASDWMWESDPENRLKRLSGRFKELTGLDQTAFLGRPFLEILREQTGPARGNAEIRRAFEACRPFRDVLCTMEQSDGALRHIRISGKPVYDADETFIGFRGVGADVTDEVDTMRQLDQLASILEASPDFVGTADVDGRVKYINRAGRAMLGLDPTAPVTDLRIKDFHSPETSRFLKEIAIPAAIHAGNWTGSTTLIGADGAKLPVSQLIVAHACETGEITHLSTVARDLRDLLAAEERFQAAQKMDALGQLTAGVAHDFNNLLLVILGNAEQLLARYSDTPELKDLATAILQAGERGSELTHRLLAFSRQQALTPRRFNPAETISALGRLLERVLAADITLETRIAENLWPVHADPAELESSLLNLAINARDAMPEGGTLTIEAANFVLAPAAPDLKREPMEAGDYVAISVRDTGEGIAPEIRDKILEPFFTTKPAGKGNGLGLPMVYGFAKQSGGHLDIESEPGRGSCFRLLLPRAQPADAVPGADEPADAIPAGHGEHVLLVEADELVRVYLAETLVHLGYHVATAEDGPSALTLLEDDATPELTIIDLTMPGSMTGREFVQCARARLPGLRVIFTTGYRDDLPRPSSIDNDGGDPVLLKPYRRETLAGMLRAVLDAQAG